MTSARRMRRARRDPTRRVATVIVAFAFLPPLAVVAAGASVRPADFPSGFLTLVIVATVVALTLARRARRESGAAGPLVLAVLAVGLLWPETAARLSGFHYDPRGVVQFGYPTPKEVLHLEPDPQLFWTLDPKLPWVNSNGFPGPEIRVPKPAGVRRIAFLGDSCTQQGFPNGVPLYLDEPRARDGEIEAITLAVVGYSSYQGRVLADRWAGRLGADLAVVYFGWNDHWQAWGGTDEAKAASGRGPFGDPPAWLAASRFGTWILAKTAGRARPPDGTLRVPIELYRENLEAIGDLFEAAGARVLLVTAPTSWPRLGVPDYIVEEKFARSKDEALALHRRYNDVVREVAKARGFGLCDLAADADRLPDPQDYFMRDGIHFVPKGIDWTAREVAGAIRGMAGVPPW